MITITFQADTLDELKLQFAEFIGTPRTRRPRREQRALSDEQVIDIRQRHQNGYNTRTLGETYGVSQATIYKIVTRQTYRDI